MLHQYEIYSKKYNLMGKITCIGEEMGVSFLYDKNFFIRKIEGNLPDDDDEIKEIGILEMEDHIEKIEAGEVEIKKIWLFNWYVEEIENNGIKIKIARGNVTGHYRLWDSDYIHTSAVESIEFLHETNEVVIETQNTRYFCPLNSWDIEQQEVYKDHFPKFEYYINEYYTIEKKDKTIEPGKVLLTISNYDTYYFHDFYYMREGEYEPIKYISKAHIGTFHDSFLIHSIDGKVDLCYFPNMGNNIEMYVESTDGRPWYIENVGIEKMYAQTSVGIIKLEPGERKEVIKENAEKEDMILPGGDLYPATIIK